MNKLWVRLSLGFGTMVLVAVFLVAMAGIFVGWSDRRDRRGDLDGVIARLSGELTTHYQQHQSWTGSEFLLSKTQAEAKFNRQLDRDMVLFLADADQHVLQHIRPEQIGQSFQQIKPRNVVPIRVDDHVVGYLGAAPVSVRNNFGEPNRFEPGPPDYFVRFLGSVLLGVAALVGVSSIVFGIVMSRTLTAPLDNLVEGAKAIGKRDLSRRVEEKGTDEVKAVAHAFNEMAADLEEAEQLRRNLIADVAHELRTPLTVVQGNLRAMLDEVYPLNQTEVTRLYDQTRLLSRLINDLHELAQAEARQLPLNIQEIDLSNLITTIGETFAPIAETKDITLHTDVPDDLPHIPVDSARLTQVLNNLLNNGLRHTSGAGSITIAAHRNGGFIRVEVSDSGEGISPEHLPHIFDRFYRTDPARSRDKGGAGLGLAIARAIIEAHDGKITAVSKGEGQGSTFTIRLPIHRSEA